MNKKKQNNRIEDLTKRRRRKINEDNRRHSVSQSVSQSVRVKITTTFLKIRFSLFLIRKYNRVNREKKTTSQLF